MDYLQRYDTFTVQAMIAKVDKRRAALHTAYDNATTGNQIGVINKHLRALDNVSMELLDMLLTSIDKDSYM